MDLFVNIHILSQFLSKSRSGEVTLLASSKSGSLLSPPPPHTSLPPFSNPEKSDTSSLPLWASPKCDTVISFSETSSARGVQTSHSALHSAVHSAQWDVCLGDDSSFVQSVRFFGSKVRPNGHYWPFFLFSQSSRLSWAGSIFDEQSRKKNG